MALSTNNIEKISGLAGLPQLEVLSLGRNCIKKLEGLDPIASTLKQLWISYNVIERLVSVLGELRLRNPCQGHHPGGSSGIVHR